MTPDVLPDEGTPFGRRVRERLRQERLIWFTAVSRDGTPVPNPVWFTWDGADEILTYNRPDAYRIAHVAARPQVSLHFNSSQSGNDVTVIRGVAERVDDGPPPDKAADYVAKYGSAMVGISGTARAFAEVYSVPLLVRITRVRGF